MEKSTATPPPPPPSATSSLPLPTAAADQRSSPAMDLDSPSVPTRPHIGGAQVPPTTDPSSRGRKRGLEGNFKMENSKYYKIRLLVKDLRPHVLEVLRTPDFRNCQAAIEIQDKMKLLRQLYQEMIGQTPKREKTTTNTHSSSLSNGKAVNPTPEPSSDNKHNSLGDNMVVGGSAFGWNFVTCGGTDAVYCGLSKEEYRTSHPIIQPGGEVEAQHHNTQL